MPIYKKGDVIKGKVTGIEDYGIFLLMDDGYSGLIHISEISDKFVKSVFDYVELGEIIKAKVLEVDEDSKKVKLTIKNFDYRVEDKEELENKNGFSPLREMLPKWIEEFKENKE